MEDPHIFIYVAPLPTYHRALAICVVIARGNPARKAGLAYAFAQSIPSTSQISWRFAEGTAHYAILVSPEEEKYNALIEIEIYKKNQKMQIFYSAPLEMGFLTPTYV